MQQIDIDRLSPTNNARRNDRLLMFIGNAKTFIARRPPRDAAPTGATPGVSRQPPGQSRGFGHLTTASPQHAHQGGQQTGQGAKAAGPCRRRVSAGATPSSLATPPRPAGLHHGYWLRDGTPSAGRRGEPLSASNQRHRQQKTQWSRRPEPDRHLSCSRRSCRSTNARANSASCRPCWDPGASPRSPGRHTRGLRAPAPWRLQ